MGARKGAWDPRRSWDARKGGASKIVGARWCCGSRKCFVSVKGAPGVWSPEFLPYEEFSSMGLIPEVDTTSDFKINFNC